MSNTKQKVSDLKHGDIIIAKIMFEENTPDYYHGHRPFDVVSKLTTNKYGQTGKCRPAVFLGVEDGEMYVATLTSKSGSTNDMRHQLELKHTKLSNSQYDNSFVEISNMRRVRIHDAHEVPIIGKVDQKDMTRLHARYEKNLMEKIHHNKYKNAHIYAPNPDNYFKHLEENGYTRCVDGYSKKDHHIIQRGDFLTSHYDVPAHKVAKEHNRAISVTKRLGDDKVVSPELDLLVCDTRELVPQLQVKYHKLPHSISAMTKGRGDNITIHAATDYGLISECGRQILKHNNLNVGDHLDSFIAWYEDRAGLQVTRPCVKTYNFDTLGLTSGLSLDDLPQQTEDLSL